MDELGALKQKVGAMDQRIQKLERLLTMKVLGNDVSTNFGITIASVIAGLFVASSGDFQTVITPDSVSTKDLNLSGIMTGPHVQDNLGTADTPTFLDVDISIGSLYTLLTNLRFDVDDALFRLGYPHNHPSGTYDAGGTPVTGISGDATL